MRRAAFLAALSIILGGCAASPDGVRTATYVGVVRVRMADRAGDLRAVDVRTLGLGFDGAAFLGWRHGQWVTADPARCQLLVVIRRGTEADAVARLFEAMGEQRPCIADFTRAPALPAAASSPGPPSPPR